jgi:uncharacterized protein YydD (DUF2326 family)
MNKLLTDKDEIIANLTAIINTLFDTSSLESERSMLQSELAVTAELIQKYVDENARNAVDQAEYQEKYNALAERFSTTQTRLDTVSERISGAKARGQSIGVFVAELEKQEGLLAEFDDDLWCSLVDYVSVHNKDDMRFVFKDGTEIQA